MQWGRIRNAAMPKPHSHVPAPPIIVGFMLILRTVAVAAAVVALVGGGVTAQRKPGDVPVDFSASVQATGALGAIATTLKVHIDRYTEDRDRTALLAALTKNGYQAFLPVFRKVPVVGYVQIKDQKWDLRWAYQQQTNGRQTVTVATDKPIYFFGGGSADAKPRAGYELAVIRLDVDDIGMGKGTLSGAARVKPSGDGQAVEVDDYAGAPVPITTVTRIFS